MTLTIQLETLENPPTELHISSGDPVSVGRDESNLVVVPGTAASRHHGFFLSAEFCWTYWDNFSTNGSVINSTLLRPGQHVVVRDGDVIRLGNFEVNCRIAGEAIPSDSAFLVFSNDGFLRSFSLNEQGIRYSVGGAGANLDLNLTGPGLTLERSSSGLAIFPDPESSVVVNGTRIASSQPLVDQDEIVIEGYSILVFDNRSIGLPSHIHATAPSHSSASAELFKEDLSPSTIPSETLGEEKEERVVDTRDGWRSEARRRKSSQGKKFIFGSEVDEFDPAATVKVPSYTGGRSGTMEVSVSQRFARAAASATSSDDEQSETLLAVFGVFVFLCIIAFVVYFVQALV